MTNDCRLTTFDNPYNPFDDFTQWFLFDVSKGYNTCGLIARLENVSEEMTEQESFNEHERVINSIIDNDVFNRYKKVYRNKADNKAVNPDMVFVET